MKLLITFLLIIELTLWLITGDSMMLTLLIIAIIILIVGITLNKFKK
jgi:hypothetical protein